MLDEYLARNNQALTELVDVHGVELRRLPDDVIEEFRLISNKILDDLAKDDENIAKVYESYKNLKKMFLNILKSQKTQKQETNSA